MMFGGRLVIWLAVCLFFAQQIASAQPTGEMGIDDFIASTYGDGSLTEEHTQLVVNMDDEHLNQYKTGNIHYDSLLYLFFVREGTPYRWGGNNWLVGVDCSHFTMKIFQDIGAYYKSYQTTNALKRVRDANGYHRVPLSEARFGDMLVYGTYRDGGWSGHVVVLVDKEFRQDRFQGLVIGSHGRQVGVKFVSYKGFPDYYRTPDIKLRNVLRVKSLTERAESLL